MKIRLTFKPAILTEDHITLMHLRLDITDDQSIPVPAFEPMIFHSGAPLTEANLDQFNHAIKLVNINKEQVRNRIQVNFHTAYNSASMQQIFNMVPHSSSVYRRLQMRNQLFIFMSELFTGLDLGPVGSEAEISNLANIKKKYQLIDQGY